MNDHIIKWLSGRQNYTIGVVLYNQFGNDEAIKKQLSFGRSEFTDDLLLKSINALLQGEEPKTAPVIINAYDEMPNDVDDVLISFKEKWMPLYTEMNYKRHALDKLLDDDFEKSGVQRGKLAKEILELEQKCIAIWHERDYYCRYKTLPGKSIDDEAIIDPFKAGKRQELLKIYVRRYKNQMAKNPANTEAAQLYKKYSDELTQLQQVHG